MGVEAELKTVSHQKLILVPLTVPTIQVQKLEFQTS